MIDESDYQIGMKLLERIIKQNRSSKGIDDSGMMNECKLCGYVWNTRKGENNSKLCPSCRSSLWDRSDVREVRCNRCGHAWITAKKNPPKCPDCGSKRWEAETIKIICSKCGMRWDDQMREGRPIVCHVCGELGPDDYIFGRARKGTLKDVTKNRTSLMNKDVLIEMWSNDDDLFREVTLRNNGFSPEQATVIVRFDRGIPVPTIASDVSMSVSQVMNIILPYMAICESMGVESWS